MKKKIQSSEEMYGTVEIDVDYDIEVGNVYSVELITFLPFPDIEKPNYLIQIAPNLLGELNKNNSFTLFSGDIIYKKDGKLKVMRRDEIYYFRTYNYSEIETKHFKELQAILKRTAETIIKYT